MKVKLKNYRSKLCKELKITPQQYDDFVMSFQEAFRMYMGDTNQVHNIHLDPIGRFNVSKKDMAKMILGAGVSSQFIEQYDKAMTKRKGVSRNEKLMLKYGIQKSDLRRSGLRVDDRGTQGIFGEESS